MNQHGRTVESVRRANLAHLLQLVHLGGPQSRAALTEATGLNRSTVADLVAELERAGLVAERSPDPSRRVGRPSPIVTVDPAVVVIAANPEVDALEIAAVGLDQGIRVRERIEVDELLTPARCAELVADRVAAWRADALADARILGVGLAVPGLVRAEDGLVRDAPHLLWTDAPVRDMVAISTGLPVSVGNDASLGAIAEQLFGAAQGINDLVYLNGGASGIGGGMVVGGHLIGGAAGYAGEFGQNRPGLALDDDLVTEHGTVEDEVSRTRILALLAIASADEATLDAVLAATTNPAVIGELARQRRVLAVALANAINVLNPRLIVLGGYLASLRAGDPAGLAAEVGSVAVPAAVEGVSIVPAGLGADRLLIGAAELAFAGVLADPAGAGAASAASAPG